MINMGISMEGTRAINLINKLEKITDYDIPSIYMITLIKQEITEWRDSP